MLLQSRLGGMSTPVTGVAAERQPDETTKEAAVCKDPAVRAESFPCPRVVRPANELSRGPDWSGGLDHIDLITDPIDRPREMAAEPIALTLSAPSGAGDETLRVESPLFLIGRDGRCDLRLTHPDIGRRHVLVQRIGSGLLFLDLGSRTGVLLNGRPERFGWLSPGDELQVGPYRISWKGATDRPALPPLPEAGEFFRRRPLEAGDAPSMMLRFLNASGGTGTSCVSLKRPITLVGRDEICKLRLRDRSVSRVHLSLMLTRRGVLAVDLVSRAGFSVNGRAAERALLRSGDRLQVGRYQLELVEEPEEVTPAADGSAVSVGSVDVSLGLSETFALCILGMLGDLQRQIHEQSVRQQEQSARQMESMVRLVETARSDQHREIVSELARLREVTAEILDVQREIASKYRHGDSERGAPAGSEIPTDVSDARVRGSLAPAPAKPASAPAARSRERPANVGRPTRRSDAAAAPELFRDGMADHLWLAERLRLLECERTTRWQRLTRLIGAPDT